MALMKNMRDTMRVAGTWMRDLKNTFQELKKAIPSIDKERLPDPKSAIKELEEIVGSILKAGMQNLKKLGNAIQDLQGAIDSIKTKANARGQDLQNVSGSVAEWWLDLKITLLELKKSIPSVDKVRLSITDGLSLDKVVEIIAGLGVPGLVLVMLMAASPYFGAAAITSSLAALGPFGMLGGIAALGILAFISKALAEFGIDQILRAVLVKLKENGTTYEEIQEEIDRYPISEELKLKLRKDIKKFCEEEIMGNETISLTPAQRLHFDIYGFVLLENVLSRDEIERMKAALYRMKADTDLDAKRVYARPGGEHHVLFGNLVAYDPALLAYAAHPKLVPLVEEVVGGAVRLEETEAIINSRNPETPRDELHKRRYNPTGFHRGTQHGWGTYIEQNKFHCIFVKTLAYLTDVGPDDGGTCVIPGSHRLTWDQREMIEAALSDDKLIYQVEASAGAVLLFAEALIHSTTAIRSDKERVILISGYTPPMVREWPGNEVSPEFIETLPEDIRPLISGSDSWHWKRRY